MVDWDKYSKKTITEAEWKALPSQMPYPAIRGQRYLNDSMKKRQQNIKVGDLVYYIEIVEGEHIGEKDMPTINLKIVEAELIK